MRSNIGEFGRPSIGGPVLTVFAATPLPLRPSSPPIPT